MLGQELRDGTFLVDVVEKILTDLDPDTALETLVTGVRTLEGVVACAILQLDQDSSYYTIRCQSGFDEAWVSAGPRFEVVKTLISKAFLEHQVVVIGNLDPVRDNFPDAFRELCRMRARNIIAAPLIAREKPLGVLCVYHDAVVAMSSQDEGALRAAANLAALAIDNAKLFQEKVRVAQDLEVSNELLRRAHTMHEWLVQVVLDTDGLDSVTRALGQLAQTAVVVEDNELNLLSIYQHTRSSSEIDGETVDLRLAGFAENPRVREHLRRVRANRRPELLPELPEIGKAVSRVTAPIVVGGNLLGFVSIVARNHRIGEFDFRLAEEGAIAIALELMKRKVAFETEQKMRGDFLQSVLTGQLNSFDEASIVIAGTQFNIRALCRAVIIREDKPENRGQSKGLPRSRHDQLAQLYRLAESVTIKAYPESMLVVDEDAVVLLLGSNSELSDGQVRALAERIVGEISARLTPLTVSVGIGEPCRHPRDLRRSFVEAKRALDAVSVLGRNSTVAFYSQLGILGILLRQTNTNELREFVGKYLAPVLDYDKKHDGDLIHTLYAYVRHDFRVDETARDVGVHFKTVAYRLQKIEQLCGVDISHSDDLINLHTAVRLHQLLN